MTLYDELVEKLDNYKKNNSYINDYCYDDDKNIIPEAWAENYNKIIVKKINFTTTSVQAGFGIEIFENTIPESEAPILSIYYCQKKDKAIEQLVLITWHQDGEEKFKVMLEENRILGWNESSLSIEGSRILHETIGIGFMNSQVLEKIEEFRYIFDSLLDIMLFGTNENNEKTVLFKGILLK